MENQHRNSLKGGRSTTIIVIANIRLVSGIVYSPNKYREIEGIKDSFNSSHAYCVALDSIYGAYLKANYPLEYYTVVLNIYKDRKEMQSYLISELPYFNIKLENIKYGKSHSQYRFDKESRTIYKGVSTIAHLNSSVADNFFKLSQEHKFDDFVDLACYVIKNSLANTRQMNILIKLDFFSDFGDQSVLLETYNTMVAYQKKKPNPIIWNSKEPVLFNKTHKEATQMKRLSNAKEYYRLVLENKDLLPQTSIYTLLANEIEYTGYATTTLHDAPDNRYVVMEINTRYTPVYKLYNLFDGSERQAKIDKRKAYKKVTDDSKTDLIINIGDVIDVLEFSERPKMRKEDDKWVVVEGQYNEFIERAKMVQNNYQVSVDLQ